MVISWRTEGASTEGCVVNCTVDLCWDASLGLILSNHSSRPVYTKVVQAMADSSTMPFSSGESASGAADASATATAIPTPNAPSANPNLDAYASTHTKYHEVQRLLGPIELLPTSSGQQRYAKPCWRCYFLDQPCIKKQAGGPLGMGSQACVACHGELGYCNAGGSIPQYRRDDRMEDYLNRTLMQLQKGGVSGGTGYVPTIAVPMQPAGKITPYKPVSDGDSKDIFSGIGSGGINAADDIAEPHPHPHSQSAIPPVQWRNADQLTSIDSLIDVIEAYNHWNAETSMRHSSVLTALSKLHLQLRTQDATVNLNVSLNAKCRAAIQALALSVSTEHQHTHSSAATATLRDMVRAFEKERRRRRMGSSRSTSRSTSMRSSRSNSVVSSRYGSRSGSVIPQLSEINLAHLQLSQNIGGGGGADADAKGSSSGTDTPCSVD